MLPCRDLCLDAATGLSLGTRESQEDAVLCDVPQGGASGVVVLADGLGGHVAGALASRIAVTTALNDLAGKRNAQGRFDAAIPGLLANAAEAANNAILAHAASDPKTAGMGATLLILVVQEGCLYWLSIGDSPLFLLRQGDIRQLNEVHSLAPQFDLLARAGEMDPELAACHPDRSCLTSALGIAPLQRIDCPKVAFDLASGDLLVAASDGILTLSETIVRETLSVPNNVFAADLVDRLLSRVAESGASEQDNLSLSILRLVPAFERQANTRSKWLQRLFNLFHQASVPVGNVLQQRWPVSTGAEGRK